MHVLLTVHQFFPEYQSGTEVLTFSVAKELLRRGHRVSVFTGYPAQTSLTDAQRFDQYEIEGIQVHRFHHAFVPMGDQNVVSELEYNNRLAASYFARLLGDLAPDVVHFFHLSRLGVGLIDAVTQACIPACYTPTDFWAACPTSQLLLPNGEVCAGPTSEGGNCIAHVASLAKWRAWKITSRLPARVIELAVNVARSAGVQYAQLHEMTALGERARFNVSRLNALQRIFSPTKIMTDMLVRQGVRPDLVVQSAYGLDVSSFTQAVPRSRVDGPLQLGFIGTLASHKGCHVLISAFRRLPEGSARLKIYGELAQFPDYVAQLRAAATGREDIEFCGTFPNHEIGEVLAGLDALVVPSVWYENAPLVVFSALAAFRPVIASNFAGMAEVVQDGSNGLLFKPRDSEHLARCLGELLDNPGLLARLSANCRPPKSIASYVDELCETYAQRPQEQASTASPLAHPQDLQPFNTTSHGSMSGWAVALRTEPRSVRVVVGGEQVAATQRLSTRSDVSKRLSLRGGSRFGFQLDLDRSIDRVKAVLEIEDRGGVRHSIPFHNLVRGRVVEMANVIVGWDHEELI